MFELLCFDYNFCELKCYLQVFSVFIVFLCHFQRKMIFSKPSDMLLRVVQLKSEFQIAVAEIEKIRSTEKVRV